MAADYAGSGGTYGRTVPLVETAVATVEATAVPAVANHLVVKTV